MESPFRPNLGLWKTGTPVIVAAALLVAALALSAERLLRPPAEQSMMLSAEMELAAQADRAETLAIRAEKILRQAKADAGLQVPDGLNASYSAFLGEEITPLVTTLGSLEAKRLAANPRWARTLTHKLHQEGVRAGDIVTAGFSGSFPALNTAVMAACDALQARVVAISSVTASNWGANQPGFTWPEMEVLLVRAGLLPPASVAITLGGDGDQARELESEVRAKVREIQLASARALRAEALSLPDLRQAIERRMQLYRLHCGRRAPVLYVNVGGSTPSLGASLAILRQRSGFIRALPFDLSPDRGVIARFTEIGVPVLNLLNIRDLAFRWNIS